MRTVELNNDSGIVIVDDDVYETLTRMGKWYRATLGHVVRGTSSAGKIYMHRIVAKLSGVDPHRLWVLHRNGNLLDNRRDNLLISPGNKVQSAVSLVS